MAGVTFRGVDKKYGDVFVIEDLNLDVVDQEFLVLVGPSGCGKTTALRMIAGLEEISRGTIAIGDHVVNDVAPKDRDIAMVFQNYALYPHMTVRENLEFGLRMRRTPEAEREALVSEAADLLGLASLLDRKPAQLSGGQRQRVALGRAIVREPSAFLMDEPLSNLDAALRVQTRAEILKLQTRLETTTIYVTHDQVEAMTLGDRVVVMKDGLVQQVGEPMELYGRPANRFVAGFIGSPAMNFAEVTIAETNGALWADAAGLRIRIPSKKQQALRRYAGSRVTLGVRPEALRVACGEDPADYAFDAIADVVEPLGNEILLNVRAGSTTMVARLDPATRLKVHETVRLAFDAERLHFFDAASEAAI